MLPSDLAERVRQYVDEHLGRDTTVTCEYHIIRNSLEFRIRTKVDAIEEAGTQDLQFDYLYPFWEVSNHNHLEYRNWGYDPDNWDTAEIVAEVCLMARRAFGWRYIFYTPDQTDKLLLNINGERA